MVLGGAGRDREKKIIYIMSLKAHKDMNMTN